MPSEESSTAATDPAAMVTLSTVFCADDADVVIRAAGTMGFRVHYSSLSLASPIFKDMFTIPQPPSVTPDTLPHVDVQESAKTWEHILRTIYPMPHPIIGDLDDLVSLLLAAKKYEMQCVIDSHKRNFGNHAFIRRDPLQLYAIACACGLDDHARFVARNADSMMVIKRSQGDDLNGLTLASYRRLITFLVERDNELRPILEEGWTSFESLCDCLEGHEGLYKHTKEKLRMPYIQMEEVYLGALEDRSHYYSKACSEEKCAVVAAEIKRFLKRMFKERERVCNKFMWKR